MPTKTKPKTLDLVERLPDGTFQVTSTASGNKYIVTIKSKLDKNGSLYFKRKCNCPAWHHCHHLDSVEKFQWDEANKIYEQSGDTDTFDALERTS